jgi:hypothetical protein
MKQHGECSARRVTVFHSLSNWNLDLKKTTRLNHQQLRRLSRVRLTQDLIRPGMTVSSKAFSISTRSCTIPFLVKSLHDVAMPVESCTLPLAVDRRQYVSLRCCVCDVVSSIMPLGCKGGRVRWIGNGLLYKHHSWGTGDGSPLNHCSRRIGNGFVSSHHGQWTGSGFILNHRSWWVGSGIFLGHHSRWRDSFLV